MKNIAASALILIAVVSCKKETATITKVDPKTGKLRLSHKALLPKPEGYQERSERPRGDRNDRGERRERPERHDRGERRERPERRESRPERTEDNQETGSEE